MGTEKVLFKILVSEVNGVPLSAGNNDFDKPELFSLAEKHDLIHLVADALIKNGSVDKDDPDYKKLKKEVLSAIYRDSRRTEAFEKISEIFEREKILYVPMKGLIVKELYPESWMRTSCDLDILIREEDLDRATEALVKDGFTTDGVKNYHDRHFYYDRSHLELHFNICEGDPKLDALLKRAFEFVSKKEGFRFEESNEFFACHHIAHTAYHFMAGGCGIRPVLDLYILRKNVFYDENGLIALLNECGLVDFYKTLCDLSEVWFGNGEHSSITERAEEYILCGGVYGTVSNGTKIGLAKNRNRVKYIFKLAFLPYEQMRSIYPSLEKHKILLPFCYIHRIFSKLFGKGRERVKNRIDRIMNSPNDSIDAAETLLNDLGLKQ